MKYLVDAQLPQLLANWLRDQGYDAKHTLDLPNANQSDDSEIIAIADREDRIVISKDSDFFDDHILRGKPKRLLVVKTGNIRNQVLIQLFENNINRIEKLFSQHALIEINKNNLVVHS